MIIKKKYCHFECEARKISCNEHNHWDISLSLNMTCLTFHEIFASLHFAQNDGDIYVIGVETPTYKSFVILSKAKDLQR